MDIISLNSFSEVAELLAEMKAELAKINAKAKKLEDCINTIIAFCEKQEQGNTKTNNAVNVVNIEKNNETSKAKVIPNNQRNSRR